MNDPNPPASASPGPRVKEFTLRAALLGVVMAAFMGAANAYLGLKAGMTIAATYTTAVVGMAVIKAFKGTILEENFARTVGSIGGNIASGAIFTLPAFFIAGIWMPFYSPVNYLTATVILAVGGILGIMFVTVTRRVLVNDKDLPFPESVAAAEIHKAGPKRRRRSGLPADGHGAGRAFHLPHRVQGRRPQVADDPGGRQRGDPPAGPGGQPGFPRRGLHHRPQAGRHQLQRRRAGLGAPGARPGLFPELS